MSKKQKTDSPEERAQKQIEKLNKISQILRYAGLNLSPQIVSVLLDEKVLQLVTTIDKEIQKNPDLSLSAIDKIIEAIDTSNAPVEAEEVPPSGPALEQV